MRQTAGLLVFAAGVFLLGLNTVGLFHGVRHPALRALDSGSVSAGAFSEISAGHLSRPSSAGIRLTREEAIAAYDTAKELPDDEQRLRAIQHIVTESTTHYYPIGRAGTSFAINPSENFILWGMALFSPVFERLGYASLDPYEFVDGEKNWERGAGLCGQLSSIVVHLVREAGLEAGKAGLDGHVVAVARTTDGREFVLDPDYGFTLEGSLEQVSREPDRVKAAVLADGHRTLERAEEIASIYGPEGNIVFWNGDRGYRPTGFMLERGAYVAKWAIPVVSLILGAALLSPAYRQWRRARRQRHLAPDSGRRTHHGDSG